MNDDDYNGLIALVGDQLREMGAETLINPELYTLRDEETGERRRLQPKEHLIEMLGAFDRHLAILDRGTFDRAVERINEVVDGTLEDVFVIPTSEDGGEEEQWSLRNAPVLGELRDDVKRLIRELRDDDVPPRGTVG